MEKKKEKVGVLVTFTQGNYRRPHLWGVEVDTQSAPGEPIVLTNGALAMLKEDLYAALTDRLGVKVTEKMVDFRYAWQGLDFTAGINETAKAEAVMNEAVAAHKAAKLAVVDRMRTEAEMTLRSIGEVFGDSLSHISDVLKQRPLD